MNFVAAKCPSCQGLLHIPDDRDFVKCMYCGSEIKVREVIRIDKDYSTEIKFWKLEAKTLIERSKESNTDEMKTMYHKAIDIYNKILILEPNDPESNFGIAKLNLLVLAYLVDECPFVILENASDFKYFYFGQRFDKSVDTYRKYHIDQTVNEKCWSLLSESFIKLINAVKHSDSVFYRNEFSDFIIDDILITYLNWDETEGKIWLHLKDKIWNGSELYASQCFVNYRLTKIAGRIGFLEYFQNILENKKISNEIKKLCELALGGAYFNVPQKSILRREIIKNSHINPSIRLSQIFHLYYKKYSDIIYLSK